MGLECRSAERSEPARRSRRSQGSTPSGSAPAAFIFVMRSLRIPYTSLASCKDRSARAASERSANSPSRSKGPRRRGPSAPPHPPTRKATSATFLAQAPTPTRRLAENPLERHRDFTPPNPPLDRLLLVLPSDIDESNAALVLERASDDEGVEVESFAVGVVGKAFFASVEGGPVGWAAVRGKRDGGFQGLVRGEELRTHMTRSTPWRRSERNASGHAISQPARSNSSASSSLRSASRLTDQ